jgi:hypothetical protein
LFESGHLDLGCRRCFRFNLKRLKLTAHALEQDARLDAIGAGQNVAGGESNTQGNPGPHHPLAKHR